MLDNSAAAIAADIIEIDEFKASDVTSQESDKNPRLVRWGYNPGLRGVNLSPQRTGQPESTIPVGVFFEINTFETPLENCTIDEYKPKENNVEITAQEAEDFIMDALGNTSSNNQVNMGFQSLLYNEPSEAVVKVINQTILPRLSFIRELFDHGAPIKNVCPGEDELDFGEKREKCASCHLDWVKSDGCLEYMEEIATNGMTVRIRRASGELHETTINPTYAQLKEAREKVQKGLETYIRSASVQWAKVVGEFDNKKRNELNDGDHMLRKDLHQLKPDQKEFGMVREFADAMNENRENAPFRDYPAPSENNELTKAVIAGQEQTGEMLKFMQEQQAQQAAFQNRMLEMIAPMLQAPAPVGVAPVEAEVPANVKQTKGETKVK